jgi:hypothetical protein
LLALWLCIANLTLLAKSRPSGEASTTISKSDHSNAIHQWIARSNPLDGARNRSKVYRRAHNRVEKTRRAFGVEQPKESVNYEKIDYNQVGKTVAIWVKK